MKYLFFLFSLLFSLETFASLKCSKNGTDLMYVGGVDYDNSTNSELVVEDIRKLYQNRLNTLDSKGNVEFSYFKSQAYNDSLKSLDKSVARENDEYREKMLNALEARLLTVGIKKYKIKLSDNIFKYKGDPTKFGLWESVKTFNVFNRVAIKWKKDKLDNIISNRGVILAEDKANEFSKDIAKSIKQSIALKKKILVIGHSEGNNFLSTAIRSVRKEDTSYEASMIAGLKVAPPGLIGLGANTAGFDNKEKTFLSTTDRLAMEFFLQSDLERVDSYVEVKEVVNPIGNTAFIPVEFNPPFDYFDSGEKLFERHSMLDYYLNENIILKDNKTFLKEKSARQAFFDFLNETAETLGSNCDVQVKSIYAKCAYHENERQGGFSLEGLVHWYVFNFSDEDGLITFFDNSPNFYVNNNNRTHLFDVQIRGKSIKLEATNPCVQNMSLEREAELTFEFSRL